MTTAATLFFLLLLLISVNNNDGKKPKINKKFATAVNATSFIWKRSVVRLTFFKDDKTKFKATGFLASTKRDAKMVILITAHLFTQATKISSIVKEFDVGEKFFNVNWGQKLFVEYGNTEADSDLKQFEILVSAKVVKIPHKYLQYNDVSSPFNVAIVSLSDKQIKWFKEEKCEALQLNPYDNKADLTLSAAPGVRCLIAGWGEPQYLQMANFLWKSSEGCNFDGKTVCLKSENRKEKASVGDYGAPILCSISTNERIISMLSGVCKDCPPQHIYGIRPDFLRFLLMS